MRPATRQLLDAVAVWSAVQPGTLVVALDGHGAAGKSTLAADLAHHREVALLHTDDFFCDPPGAGSGIGAYYDWAALRSTALEPLLTGKRAHFRRGPWVEPGPPGTVVQVDPATVIVLEGVSACAPALADLVHRRVLVETTAAERHRRINAIWAAADWDHDWLAAEAAYLATLPPSAFDLVLSGDG